MNDLNELMGWGPKRPWPTARDPLTIPADVRRGDWVMTDLKVRPSMTETCRELGRADFLPDSIWQVETGEAFQLDPLAGICTHAATDWYRVWGGEPLDCIEEADAEDLTEEELLRLLMDEPETEGAR